MSLKPEIIDRVKKLEEKYSAMGQDLASYLDGLLYADYLTYWDYIHLDTLLSLQNPKTNIPDENIFIMYHQITELYFKLILSEIDQICNHKNLTKEFFINRLERINRYFEQLTSSFDVMVDGMEPGQFLKFRMSLLPASGFQSGQYRTIEIKSTNFYNLLQVDERDNFSEDSSIEDMYASIYWKRGGIELKSGKKTLTLKQFEKKYSEHFIKTAKEFQHKNLSEKYNSMTEEDKNDPLLIDSLKRLDTTINVNWCLSHYRSAVKYLQMDPMDIEATGGTNWQKFLPPRFQRLTFFPELWKEEELNNWGKGWVEDYVFASFKDQKKSFKKGETDKK